jgi:hypothetical protein
MSLLNEDAAPKSIRTSAEGMHFRTFGDGALAIFDRETGQLMHLGPAKAVALQKHFLEVATEAAGRIANPPPTPPREQFMLDATQCAQCGESLITNTGGPHMCRPVTWGGKDAATKPTNPKDAIGSDKLPLHLWPTTATILGSLGLLDGMLKYGRTNWREAGVRASIYYDAARRHLDAWFEGEDEDPDSGLPHLAHALACLAILVDARAANRLTDDRMYRGAFYRAVVFGLTPHVKRLKDLHAGRAPKHYTIEDRTP